MSQHYFLVADYRAAATRGLATYVWRALSPIWQSFSRASDLVVTFVTVDRYRVMRRVDQLNGQDNRATTRVGDSHAIGGGVVFRRRLWRVRCQMVAALAVGLALNTPYCFQFTIEPCSDDPRESFDCCRLSERHESVGRPRLTVDLSQAAKTATCPRSQPSPYPQLGSPTA